MRSPRIFIPVLLVLVTVLATALYGWHTYRAFLDEPLPVSPDNSILLVERGMTVRKVITTLEQMGLTRSDWRWRVLLRVRPVTIKAGEYALDSSMTPISLLGLLASGEVIRYRFTIIEGWTFRELLQALAADPVLTKVVPDFDGNERLLAALNPELSHPEGWFLPETYLFTRGDSDLDILHRSHQAMRTALDRIWAERSDGLPIKSAYELLILASIVEKETSVAAERAEIAGVFTRRLQQRWRLETDPTVIYGLGETFDGDIRRRDLDTDTPYNTYTRYGLPPTPIALPGEPALIASAHPAAGKAMFFVASGDGGHVFSETLEQHNAAVRRMLRNRP